MFFAPAQQARSVRGDEWRPRDPRQHRQGAAEADRHGNPRALLHRHDRAGGAGARRVLPKGERRAVLRLHRRMPGLCRQRTWPHSGAGAQVQRGPVPAHRCVGQLAPKLSGELRGEHVRQIRGRRLRQRRRALSHMLRTTPEFIESQRKGSFAAFIRNVTDSGTALRFPFGYLEQFPRSTKGEMAALREQVRRRYAVHYSEVEQAISARMNTPKDAYPRRQGGDAGIEGLGGRRIVWAHCHDQNDPKQ